MKLTLCIPLYNEEAILPATMKTVSEYMESRFGEDYEVLYVNDGSADRSEEILAACPYPRTRHISYQPNRGKGYAVRQGMLKGEGEIIIFTDCDLAYGCEVVGEMVDLFDAHPEYDGVIGSRSKHPLGYEGYTFLRKVASKTYLKVLSVVGGLKLSDSQSGIKGFRQKSARTIFSRCEVDRFAFDFEAILIADAAGKKIGEMPVHIINHRASSVHLLRDSTRMIRDLTKMKRRVRKMTF